MTTQQSEFDIDTLLSRLQREDIQWQPETPAAQKAVEEYADVGTSFTAYTTAVRNWEFTAVVVPTSGGSVPLSECGTKRVVQDWEATVVKRKGGDSSEDYQLLFYPKNQGQAFVYGGPDFSSNAVPADLCGLSEKVKSLFYSVERKAAPGSK